MDKKAVLGGSLSYNIVKEAVEKEFPVEIASNLDKKHIEY
jgi:hypothetical protein